jgi:hypothetical protein
VDPVERWLHHEDDVLGIAGRLDRIVKPARGSGVVVTAPHAVPHQRDAATKRADMWSGGLALLLAELTGAAAVVETSGVGDPSWEASHPFKEAVAQLVPRVVVDLHAMRSQHGEVELGTGAPHGDPPTEIADVVRRSLEHAGIATVVDRRFPARGHDTLVQWALRRGVMAVQVEVSVRLVPPFASVDDARALIGGLSAAIAACDALAR